MINNVFLIIVSVIRLFSAVEKRSNKDVFRPLVMILATGLGPISAVQAGEVLRLTLNEDARLISGHLEIWKDESKSLTFQQFLEYQKVTEPVVRTKEVPNLGVTNAAYWAFVDVRSDTDEHWVVESLFTGLDYVDLYYFEPDGELRHHSAGRNLSFSDRTIKHNNVAFSLETTAGVTKRLYFRFENYGTVSLPIYIGQRELMFEKFYEDHGLKLLFFGFMAAVVLYNLFIAISLRKASYYLYVAFHLFVMAHQASSNGIALQYVWPTSPPQNGYDYNVLIMMALALPTLFFRHYVSRRHFSDRMYSALFWVSMTKIAFALLITFIADRYFWIVPYMTYYAVFVVVGVLLLSLSYIRQSLQARFFAAAWLLFTLSIIAQAMWHAGLVSYTPVSSNLDEMFILAEMVILSIGLSVQVYIVSLQKETAEQQLISSQQETIDTLSASKAFKENLIAEIGHELKTPLASMVGMSDQLYLEGAANEQSRLKIIRDSGRRIDQVINDILILNSDKNHVPDIRIERVDANDLIEQVIQLVKHKSDRLGISVHYEAYEAYEALPVKTDAAKLNQIVLNLIDNAIKYARSAVYIDMYIKDASLNISVRDDGVGNATLQESTIFLPRKQLDPTREGSGIGLAVTQRLITLLHGEIKVFSAKGQGTIFEVKIPVPDQQAVGDYKIEADSINRLAGTVERIALVNAKATILIVDDEPNNLELLKGYLSTGYSLILTDDANKVAALIENEKVDLVLMDMMMPGLSGTSLCKQVRNHKSRAELPIIFISAKSLDEDIQAGYAAGANDYLPKPFIREELFARIEAQLSYADTWQLERQNAELKEQINENKPSEGPLLTDREQLQALLQRAIEYWHIHTGKSGAHLGEASGYWSVSLDGSRLRARTMERYLSLETMPKRPKWKPILDTAYYVLSEVPLTRERHATLTEQIESFLATRKTARVLKAKVSQ